MQLFPRPPELEPAVRFWTRVYTEVDTQSGLLHDARNLTVVCDRMPLDRRQIENRRNQIQTDLRVLAGGKRSGLSEGQRQILFLWPEDVSNEVLREAVDNVRFQLGQSDRFGRPAPLGCLPAAHRRRHPKGPTRGACGTSHVESSLTRMPTPALLPRGCGIRSRDRSAFHAY